MAAALSAQAASQGNARGQFNLASMLHQGMGIPKDLRQAIELYQLAAAQGLSSALNTLGTFHERGTGVPKDEIRALELYELAAMKGNGAAQFNLAVLHYHGSGEKVPQNLRKAISLLQQAMANGIQDARYCWLCVDLRIVTSVDLQ